MKNLINGDQDKTFYVWINPRDMYAMHNARIGSFVSVSNRDDNLMFLPNPKFSGYISPFQENLLKSYQTEYNLETERKKKYNDYPSRLSATFLFDSEEDAKLYKETHMAHVADRELKKGFTVGKYTFSRHDLGWIDFLRSPFILDEQTKDHMIQAYWKGETVKDYSLDVSGMPIKAVATSIFEVLFIGRIDFEK